MLSGTEYGFRDLTAASCCIRAKGTIDHAGVIAGWTCVGLSVYCLDLLVSLCLLITASGTKCELE